MSTLAQLPLAPLRPWDAVICTSQAVLKSVQQLLDQQFEYLKWKLGATRFELPQLPVIPLGVHVKDYEFSEAQKKAAREKLGLSENDSGSFVCGALIFSCQGTSASHVGRFAKCGQANQFKKDSSHSSWLVCQ
jgi:alpha-maltose-1-phosphate synthase